MTSNIMVTIKKKKSTFMYSYVVLVATTIVLSTCYIIGRRSQKNCVWRSLNGRITLLEPSASYHYKGLIYDLKV